MTATSVTGIGLGSADGQNKGSSHMTLGAGHLIGPRVVAADMATLDGSGDATVILPVLPGVSADYIVSATDSTVVGATAVGADIVITATETTVTLIGTASQTVAWSIIKRGLAL
jgi:hypothetical protein